MRKKFLFFIIPTFCFGASMVLAGTLTCTVTSTCAGGTIIFRMSSSSNGHAELASQSNYGDLVCCSGVVGLSNSCSGAFAVALKLASTSNAHVEQNTQSNYTNNACISADNVSISYQASDCSGFDTTLGSMSSTSNAHVGSSSVYVTQICGTASVATVSCSTNISSTAFGSLSSAAVSTATINASTTATCGNSLGCTLTVQDAGNGVSPGLATTSPAYLIASANATLVAGTEGYGIQATSTATGSGAALTISPVYNKNGNNVGGLLLFPTTLASSTTSFTSREVEVTHMAAVAPTTLAAIYSDTITYSCTGN